MKLHFLLSVVAGIASVASPLQNLRAATTDDAVSVMIIRHGEKPKKKPNKEKYYYNLSCEGLHRALQLPPILERVAEKHFHGPIKYIYVPLLGAGKATKHSRMFQTASPFAIRNKLHINSKYSNKYDVNDKETIKTYDKLVNNIKKRNGPVLVVWDHKEITHIVERLTGKGYDWNDGKDFDRILIIKDGELVQKKQNIVPSSDCFFN